jgi:thiol reductant ABC exporter CydD subunit
VKPLDPRLLRHARQARLHLAVLIMLGTAAAGLLIAQAQLLAGAITAAVSGGAGLVAGAGSLVLLATVIAGRAAAAWATQVASYRASAAVKRQLRHRLLARAVELGPGWLAAHRSGKLTALATEGLDALDGYFAGYLPQIVLAVIVPLAVVTAIGLADPLSALVIVCTLPLIPLFGALIGAAAGRAAERRWRALGQLAHHFLDVVTGLPTLKVFGRSKAQRETIARVTGEYRRASMATLRLAFLSSMVLELAATLSVALVATEIGLRLAYGHLGLRTGLIALILAPEAYLPLRAAGVAFHASADGLAAASEAFDVIEAPATPAGTRPAPPPGEIRAVRVEGVSVRHPGRRRPAPDGACLTLNPGEVTAVTGPSGCGKTTLIAVLLGFVQPSAGRVLIAGPDGEADLAETSLASWRSRISWAAQEPALFHGTVESNIRLGWPGAPAAAVAAAARAAGLDEVLLSRPVGERGGGLSAGERRRVALARALLPPATVRPLLLADEPTAGLDPAAEASVLAALRAEAAAGRIILIAAHHRAVMAAADHVIALGSAGRDAPEAAREVMPA